MIRIVFNKLLRGWFVVRGPHQTPISGRFPTKQAAIDWLERHRVPRWFMARVKVEGR